MAKSFNYNSSDVNLDMNIDEYFATTGRFQARFR